MLLGVQRALEILDLIKVLHKFLVISDAKPQRWIAMGPERRIWRFAGCDRALLLLQIKTIIP